MLGVNSATGMNGMMQTASARAKASPKRRVVPARVIGTTVAGRSQESAMKDGAMRDGAMARTPSVRASGC